jgi:hypothetical protein
MNKTVFISSIERAYELNKEIRTYLVDEQNATFAIRHIDLDDQRRKLEAFKALLRERHTIESFTSVDDLKEKLGRDLKRLLTEKQVAESNADEILLSSKLSEVA